jgi:hypothetical protein
MHVTNSYSWEQANQYCVSNGGYMVTYHTRQEQVDVEVGALWVQHTPGRLPGSPCMAASSCRKAVLARWASGQR